MLNVFCNRKKTSKNYQTSYRSKFDIHSLRPILHLAVFSRTAGRRCIRVVDLLTPRKVGFVAMNSALSSGFLSLVCSGTPRNTCRRVLMKSLAMKLKRFLTSEDGPTAVEYAVMLSLIVVVCLTAVTSIGTKAKTTFSNVASQLGS